MFYLQNTNRIKDAGAHVVMKSFFCTKIVLTRSDGASLDRREDQVSLTLSALLKHLSFFFNPILGGGGGGHGKIEFL